MKSLIRVASCQFSVESDLDHNLHEIVGQIRAAADQRARVVHFPEAALSGYAGVDMPGFDHFNWDALTKATETICREAAEQRVWVLLGSAHRLSGGRRPHNSVYVISDEGRIVERYDKRFCTGQFTPEPELDHCHYTPGNHASIFEIDGFACSALICYDYRFPELYRDLKRRGVEIIFQSFHNARKDQRTYEQENLWRDIVPATMMCRAATGHFWISATNSTARYSLWPSFFVRPDGRIAGRLEEHRAGILITEVDPAAEYWDAAAPWRERAMNGQLHSGQLCEDPRSTDRTCY